MLRGVIDRADMVPPDQEDLIVSPLTSAQIHPSCSIHSTLGCPACGRRYFPVFYHILLGLFGFLDFVPPYSWSVALN